MNNSSKKLTNKMLAAVASLTLVIGLIPMQALALPKPQLLITPVTQTVTYNGQTQGPGDVVYSDPAQIAEAFSIEGLMAGDMVSSIVLDGQGKDARDYDLVPHAAAVKNATGEDVTDDYVVVLKPGMLTVEPAKVTVTTGSASKTYDGSPLEQSLALIEGLVGGESATVRATGSQTDAGSSANGYAIEWGATDKNNYDVAEKLGTLTVERAKAGIAVDSASKAQGEPDPVFTGKVEGLVAEGDLGEVRYVRTNTEEAPGAYKGVLDATYTPNPNYDVAVAKGDFTIKAVYTLRWLGDDGSVLQEKTYAEGEPAPSYDGQEPTRAATAQYTYAFAGWDEGTVEGQITTYRPVFSETLNEYTVRFVNDDGTELQSGKVAYGETPAYTGAKPAKAATAQFTYEFAGWSPAVAPVTGDATYTAAYTETVNRYTVTFVDYDGATVLKEAAEYDYGTPAADVARPADPARPADAQHTYAFKGWTPEVVDVTADAVYTAVYESSKRSYEITWLQDDGTLIDRTMVEYGQKPAHADPTKAATEQFTYTFAGWTPEVVPVTGDATYTATYDEHPVPAKKGTLTFDFDGATIDGKTSMTIEASIGDVITIPQAPTREGYTFKYWKGSVYYPGDKYTVEGPHTFTAVWERNAPAPKVKHTVTFDANGHGTAPAAQEVEDGAKAEKPTDPKANGWTFGGWFTDKEGKEAYDFSKPVTADITLYAKWTQVPTKKPAGSSGNRNAQTTAPVARGTTANTGEAPFVPGALIAAGLCAAVCAVSLRRLTARK